MDDAVDREGEGVSTSPRQGESSGAEVNNTWADLPEPKRSITESHHQVIDEKIDSCHLFITCLDSIQPAVGCSEDGRRLDLKEEVSEADALNISLATEGQLTCGSQEVGSPQLRTDLNTESRTIVCWLNGIREAGEACSLGGADSCKNSNEVIPLSKSGEAQYLSCADVQNNIESPGESNVSFLTAEVGGGGTDHSLDRKSRDFNTAPEKSVIMDNVNSKTPKPTISDSSRGLVINPNQQPEHKEALILNTVIIQNFQQGELHHLSLPKERQEAQQVFKGSPPLVTVAQESANQEPGCHVSASVVVRELLRGTGWWREREREEEEGGQTGRGKEEKEARFHVGEAGIEKLGNKGKGETKETHKLGQRAKSAYSSDRAVWMEGDNGDDNQSDSGVSVDFSPGSTMQLHPVPDDVGGVPAFLGETPIEREIRQAAEREQSLRRARGLSKTEEFVHIPLRRSILSQPLPAKLGRVQGKDRLLAGKKMQWEIKMESEREQALVQLGKVPGFYDKGSVGQLRERKLLFEALQESQLAKPPLSKRPSAQRDSASTAGSDPGHLHSTLHLSKELSQPRVSCGPTLSEGPQGQVILQESVSVPQSFTAGLESPPRPSHSTDCVTIIPTATNEGEEENDQGEPNLPKENPFFKLRSSISLRPKVEQDIRETRERERELRRQRNSLYRGETSGTASGRRANTETRISPKPRYSLPSTDQVSRSPSPTPPARPGRKLDLVWPPAPTDEKRTAQLEEQVRPLDLGQSESTVASYWLYSTGRVIFRP
uniref:Uncharacterized LOC111833501 n=1 Tax=Paramormyrops kingsleyae TaxID=1676925 RepID=A0A3B3S6G4_9TELE